MLSNRRSATERSEPFPGLDNGGGNINSGFGQILPKRNCSSRTDIQNKLHKYPFQGTECLQHRRCNPHLRFTVQAGPPPHLSQRAQRTIITQHAIIPRGAFARSTVECSTVSRHHPPHYQRFYRALGQRVKQLRKKKGYTQEDMISFGFGLRHWQQIEGGHPINISTLLRICEAFDLRAWQIIRGLDDGFPRSQRRDINARTR